MGQSILQVPAECTSLKLGKQVRAMVGVSGLDAWQEGAQAERSGEVTSMPREGAAV